jgi:hypothetical protein
MNFSHFMAAISVITAFVVIGVFGYVFYLLVYPFNVVTLQEFSVPARVVQGEPIPYTLRFDKHLNYKPTTRYYVTHPNHQPLEIITSSVNRPTKEQTVNLALSVPASLPVECGYKLQVDLEYSVIFSRTIPYTWESNDFCITQPKEVS